MVLYHHTFRLVNSFAILQDLQDLQDLDSREESFLTPTYTPQGKVDRASMYKHTYYSIYHTIFYLSDSIFVLSYVPRKD